LLAVILRVVVFAESGLLGCSVFDQVHIFFLFYIELFVEIALIKVIDAFVRALLKPAE